MGDIVLCVADEARPDSMYCDGDVIAVWSDGMISLCNGQRVCGHHTAPLNVHGLRPPGSLLDRYLDLRCQLKIERVSRKEVLVTDRWAVSSKLRSDTTRPYFYVEDFLRHVLKSPRHEIFGVPGAEYWYGGRKHTDRTFAEAAWDMIEGESSERRVNYRRYPLGTKDVQVHLPMSIEDHRDEVAKRLQVPERDDRDNPVALNYARRCHVNWRAIRGIQPRHVLNRGRRVDLRNSAELLVDDVLVKPRKTFWEPDEFSEDGWHLDNQPDRTSDTGRGRI